MPSPINRNTYLGALAFLTGAARLIRALSVLPLLICTELVVSALVASAEQPEKILLLKNIKYKSLLTEKLPYIRLYIEFMY